jgi:K+-transporting ATPase ATPase A chain
LTFAGWLQIGLLAGVVVALILPLGRYMAQVFTGAPSLLQPVLGPIERAIYRLAGVDPEHEQGWLGYAVDLLGFHLVGAAALYALLRLQDGLPLNPQHAAGMSPDLAFNTAISFVTNTSWQSYAGETALSALSQMAGIAVASFLSGAAGIAVAIALIRAFARSGSETIGNFWVDLTRAVLYVLLPLSLVGAVLLAVMGVPQTLNAGTPALTLEGVHQAISMGPVASQEAIKLLSGDGGGYFNANSAHPFENPTPLSNLLEMVLILMIGAALTNTFGRMIGSQRQGWALFGAMAILFTAGAGAIYASEAARSPAYPAAVSGPNLEGKEVRFGAAGSSVFAEVSTASADGAVNSMHDSFMPLSGAVLMANMKVGEVIIGAPGSGLFSMMLFAVLAVFTAGLMVGRTPEYLGKKIEAREMKLVVLATLVAPVATLGFAAAAALLPIGLAGREASGPHGLSEILYAYTSAAATNGSAFAGLNANTPFYNTTLAVAMTLGRFGAIVPVLALAGALAAKPRMPPSAGTMPSDNGLFVGLLIGVILIMGALIYFPVLTLAPILEQLSPRPG